MTIKIGDRLPDATLYESTDFGETCPIAPTKVPVAEAARGKKIVTFGLPGAYTPTCSAKHVPGYLEHLAELKARKVDEVGCVSVNDGYVMAAWSDDASSGDTATEGSTPRGRFRPLSHQDRPMNPRATRNALAAIALWGSLATLSVRLREVPPFLLVGLSLLLGSVFGLRHLSLAALRPRALLIGVYGLFAYHFCLFVALRLAPPVEANLVNYLWPLLIVLLSPLLLPGARLSARHVIGALLGFSGAALLVTGGRLGFGANGLAGYLLALLAAVIWSTYSLLSRRLGGFSRATISSFCLASGALSLACHALLEPRYTFTLADLPPLLLIGLGPLGAAFYLWDRALQEGDPRVIGTLAYLTPLLSTLLLTLFGGGQLGPVSLAAMGLIVGGAVVGTWGGAATVAPAPRPR